MPSLWKGPQRENREKVKKVFEMQPIEEVTFDED